MKKHKFEFLKKYLSIFILLSFLGCHKSQKQQKKEVPSNSKASTEVTQAIEEKRDSITLFKPYEIKDSSLIQTYPSGLKIYIVEKGNGAIPKVGQTVIAHYHGVLPDGRVFDSSFERNQPFQFVVGKGQVIKGWDEAFQKLPVGTKAILIIPPELGYGDQQVGPIPPNSTLIFHVEVLGTIDLVQ